MKEEEEWSGVELSRGLFSLSWEDAKLSPWNELKSKTARRERERRLVIKLFANQLSVALSTAFASSPGRSRGILRAALSPLSFPTHHRQAAPMVFAHTQKMIMAAAAAAPILSLPDYTFYTNTDRQTEGGRDVVLIVNSRSSLSIHSQFHTNPASQVGRSGRE